MAAKYDGFIFDLDGTIYLGDRLIPGADEAVRRTRDGGGRTVFISNKTIEGISATAAKLNRLGIPVAESDVLNSSWALVRRLSELSPSARLYVIGERALTDDLRAAGFRISNDERAVDWVVLSFDRTFHYGKLDFALRAVRCGARLCATNPDRTCPFEGRELPDAAGMIGAVEAVTGAKVEFIAGKPSPLLVQEALRHIGCEPGRCIMVGDRIETDIVMGRAAGVATALVLSGVTTRAALEASSVRPDYVLESIAGLVELI